MNNQKGNEHNVADEILNIAYDVFGTESITHEEMSDEYLKAIEKCSETYPALRIPLKNMQFSYYQMNTIYVTFEMKHLMDKLLLERKIKGLVVCFSEIYGKPVTIKMGISGETNDVSEIDEDVDEDIPEEYTHAIQRCAEEIAPLKKAMSQMEYVYHYDFAIYIRFPDRYIRYLEQLEQYTWEIEDIFQDEFNDAVELHYYMGDRILQRIIDTAFDIFGHELHADGTATDELSHTRRGAKEAQEIIPSLRRMEYVKYTDGVLSAVFAKRNEKYLNVLLEKKEYIEAICSEVFSEPVTLSICLKSSKPKMSPK